MVTAAEVRRIHAEGAPRRSAMRTRISVIEYGRRVARRVSADA